MKVKLHASGSQTFKFPWHVLPCLKGSGYISWYVSVFLKFFINFISFLTIILVYSAVGIAGHRRLDKWNTEGDMSLVQKRPRLLQHANFDSEDVIQSLKKYGYINTAPRFGWVYSALHVKHMEGAWYFSAQNYCDFSFVKLRPEWRTSCSCALKWKNCSRAGWKWLKLLVHFNMMLKMAYRAYFRL